MEMSIVGKYSATCNESHRLPQWQLEIWWVNCRPMWSQREWERKWSYTINLLHDEQSLNFNLEHDCLKLRQPESGIVQLCELTCGDAHLILISMRNVSFFMLSLRARSRWGSLLNCNFLRKSQSAAYDRMSRACIHTNGMWTNQTPHHYNNNPWSLSAAATVQQLQLLLPKHCGEEILEELQIFASKKSTVKHMNVHC